MENEDIKPREERTQGDSGIDELANYAIVSQLMPRGPRNWFDARAYERAVPPYRRAIK